MNLRYIITRPFLISLFLGRQIYGPDRSKHMGGGPVFDSYLLGWAGPVGFLDRPSRVIYGPVYDYISPPIVREKQVSNSFLAFGIQ
jgi:hypothetical protein